VVVTLLAPARKGDVTTMIASSTKNTSSSADRFSPLDVERVCRALVQLAREIEEITHAETTTLSAQAEGREASASLGRNRLASLRQRRHLRQAINHHAGEDEDQFKGNAN
jgi:hypothetical protein